MKITNIQYCIDDMSQSEYIAFMKHEHNVSIYFNMKNDADDELTIVGRDNDVKNAMKDNFDSLNPVYMMAESGARRKS